MHLPTQDRPHAPPQAPTRVTRASGSSSSEASSLSAKIRFASLLIVACSIITLHCWIRSPAIALDYFHNEDTAGITYSADLILRGGSPLIDTVEMKAPGSFSLLAGWWCLMGRSLMSAQLLGALWAGLAALGVMLGAWILYRSVLASCVAGLLYVYLAPFTDSVDINYGAWMIAPYVWASVALFWTCRLSISPQRVKRPSSSRLKRLSCSPLSRWALVGVLIALAALMKRQGAALFPLALILAIRSPERSRASLGLVCGALVCFLCFFSTYIARGQGVEAMSSYFFSRSGWRYLASTLALGADHNNAAPMSSPLTWQLSTLISTAKLQRIGDGVVGLREHLPLSLSLALLNITSQLALSPDDQAHQSSRATRVTLTLIMVCLLSFLGASLGLRFFKGYYLQVLPGLIWLAVDPRGLPWAWSRASDTLKRWSLSARLIRPLSIIALLALSALYIPSAAESSWGHLRRARAMRSRPLYEPARQIKQIADALKHRHVTQYMKHKDKSRGESRDKRESALSLWVWGRWAWPAYFYLDAPSPTRYFKNLGVLTTQLNNTWRRGGAPTRFDPNTPWREAIAELRAHPPEVIIIARNESYRDFHALRSLLRSRYRKLSYRELSLKRARSARQLFEVYELKRGELTRSARSVDLTRVALK